MRITGVESTGLFTGSAGRPLQIIRITLEGTPGDQPGGAPGSLLAGGPGIDSPGPFGLEMPPPGASRVAEIGVAVGDRHPPGAQAPVTVIAEDRALVRSLLADGRLELVGGTYNEPNTNLTGAEVTIRNAVYGVGFQRDVLGGDPRSAWMLDSFGHDPGFPGLMAAAGLTSSSWARGPFHQWGPADNARMQFPAEFEWLSPDGTRVLTAYLTNP